uniref:Uncharacterized protein n=1 Tax=Amphimedon queenslandica TaxID=400682 RepID=A0A1X7VX61_AMPQE
GYVYKYYSTTTVSHWLVLPCTVQCIAIAGTRISHVFEQYIKGCWQKGR